MCPIDTLMVGNNILRKLRILSALINFITFLTNLLRFTILSITAIRIDAIKDNSQYNYLVLNWSSVDIDWLMLSLISRLK